ncbi:glutathione S-transferase [Rhodosalinus halophilus]|uniref:Glutathione S-transferase n=1 Tax=Rhodosalinus halophilus TaxID=2259333 RepID=A0A365UCA1_9RHOB|nr:glutathione S-transferase family protein [Rhodosalinus halophilus]RBI86258.1 glutathione S-transferase [Rhodosalinus halophilus]
MYTVIGDLKSRAFRVIWMLEELGQPYEHRPEPPRSEAVRALNASGKIPVLLEGEAVLTDSTAILTYLADKHGQMTHPAGTISRARQDAMTFRILDEIESALWTAARHSFVLPEDKRVPQVKDSLKWEYANSIERLMDDLPADYLAGAEPTVPDILLAHCGGWAKAAGFPAEEPRFAEYLRRMRARPAFRRVAEMAKAA